MIDAVGYCAAYCLKAGQVFVVFIRDIQYQREKKVKAEAYLKSVVPQENHDFLDVFLKKYSDILLLGQKYDHKIQPEEDQKRRHTSLYKTFSEELNTIQQYCDNHLSK